MTAQITYVPYTKTFYRGSLEEGDFSGRHASVYEPIAKLNPERKWGDGRLEFTAELIRGAEREYNAGAQTTTDISIITTTMMLDQVIGSAWRQMNAANACTRQPVPKLHLDIPVRKTKSGAQAKVPELNQGDITATEFAKASFDLWKNVYTLYASDESRLRANFDAFQYDINQAGGALALVGNTQIATEIETFGTSSKGNWATITNSGSGFHSERNAIDDITDEIVTLLGRHYTPDTICMHPSVAVAYKSNTYVKGVVNPVTSAPGSSYPLPGFSGIQVIEDVSFTSTSATLFARNTMLLGEGPVVAEQYRDYDRGADAYVVRQFIQPLNTTVDAGVDQSGVELTSVAA